MQPTNGYNPYEYQIQNSTVSYGAVEFIRLLTAIDKKLYVIIKKLENLGQPEKGGVEDFIGDSDG